MANEKALEVLGAPDNSKAGPVDTVHPPKTLRQLEKVVEGNVSKGAAAWRLAADALLEIKTQKLWRKAKDANGDKYGNFVEYAEDRFGIKKTYAYDLVKAATRSPKALTEGAARAEANADRTPAPYEAHQAVTRMRRTFSQFEDRMGDIRDRAVADENFTREYDRWLGTVQTSFAKFADRFPEPIPAEAVDVSAKREDANE